MLQPNCSNYNNLHKRAVDNNGQKGVREGSRRGGKRQRTEIKKRKAQSMLRILQFIHADQEGGEATSNPKNAANYVI